MRLHGTTSCIRDFIPVLHAISHLSYGLFQALIVYIRTRNSHSVIHAIYVCDPCLDYTILMNALSESVEHTVLSWELAIEQFTLDLIRIDID